MKVSFLFLGVVIAMLAISARANPFPAIGQVGAGINVNHYFMGDSGSGAIDDLGDFSEISLSGSRFLTPKLSFGLEAGYGDLKTKNLNGDVDAYRLSGGYRLHFSDHEFYSVRPYLGLGLDLNHFNSSTFDKEKTEVAIYGEAGMETMLTESLMLTAGLKSRVEVADGYTDVALTTGITHFFGSSKYERKASFSTEKPVSKFVSLEVAAKPEPAPKPEPEPELEAEPQPGKIIAQSRFTEESLTFASGSSAISAESDIRPLSAFIGSVTNLSDLTIIVEGHTDSVGSDAANQRLSLARAKAVESLLIQEFGISTDVIVTRGLGEAEPISSNATAQGRSENRRVEIKIRDDRSIARS